MPETIKQKALQLERELWSLEVFPYISCGEAVQLQTFEVTELTYVYDVYIVKTRQYKISAT